ncbi:MAG: cytochrome-c oxidase, cbb3-type subunit III [Pseudomonadota bacterium]
MSETGQKMPVDEHSGIETTGHEWDGIRELDNPLPRWWLWIFYATILWAVIYMVFMPAWPAPPGMQGHTRGLRDHSERANVAAAMENLEAMRGPMFARLQEAADGGGGIDAIIADPDLLNFARAAGESAFGDNCATCHGAGGQGFIGYPNLNDDVWLWGGSFDDIRHTLHVGIRWDENQETRFSQMPAYGRDELLTSEELNAVTDHVMTLASLAPAGENAALGAEIFETQCATCHMEDGRGDRTQGAPSLVDAEWLYGGSRDQIRNSIWRGPYGVMPAWDGRLDEPVITALAAYVYLLGGGEAEASAQAPAIEMIEAGR